MTEQRVWSATTAVGCSTVVLLRDGERTVLTANYNPTRLHVAVEAGILVGLDGVN
jgi:hypothetical protein